MNPSIPNSLVQFPKSPLRAIGLKVIETTGLKAIKNIVLKAINKNIGLQAIKNIWLKAIKNTGLNAINNIWLKAIKNVGLKTTKNLTCLMMFSRRTKACTAKVLHWVSVSLSITSAQYYTIMSYQ